MLIENKQIVAIPLGWACKEKRKLKDTLIRPTVIPGKLSGPCSTLNHTHCWSLTCSCECHSKNIK